MIVKDLITALQLAPPYASVMVDASYDIDGGDRPDEFIERVLEIEAVENTLTETAAVVLKLRED